MDETTTPPQSDIPWKQIGRPATRALTLAGYTSLEQVAAAGEKHILALHGVGPKAIRLLRAAMDARGLKFNP